MMFLLNKTFLSLDDLAYIFNQHGFYVDLDNPKQDKKFLTSLRDLMHESKLTPLFFYDGTISNLDGSNGQHYRGYFIYDTRAISHFITSKELSIVTCKPYNAYFRYDEKKPYRLNQPNAITLSIYFHKTEAEKLFQSNAAIETAISTVNTDEQLQQANIELAEQLAGVNAQHEAAQAKIAALEAQIIEQQKTIEQLTQQAAAPADDDPLFDELDKRTQNNFVRLFIALNELANAKKGGISLDKSYNKEHNDLINAALDRLGYIQIGEAGYKTLIDLIKEKRQKGL